MSIWGSAERRYFFGDGEDSGLAGDYQEAMRGVAEEPARPLQAAGIDGAIEAVPDQGVGDETG
jgi:hypothetical protein